VSVATLDAAASNETQLIEALRGAMDDCPFQVNRGFSSDAELLDLGGPELVAVTVDTLQSGEELETATDPYSRGRLAATASLSDLAAVGARPLALLLSCCFDGATVTDAQAAEFGRGASEAARAQGTFVVGGDTNWAGEESFTSVAIGHVAADRALSRVGASAGDTLYVTAPVGGGNAAGVRKLLGEEPAPWLPTARCAAGRALAGHAEACIDTSDGLVTAALMLADLNGLGVEIDDGPELYDPAGLELAKRLGLPRWLLAAGEWGEFELLFAVAPAAEDACLSALAAAGLSPCRAGRLTAEREFAIVDGEDVRIDALEIARSLRAVERSGSMVQELAALVGRA
jgi:thiamine-monophosphate kinase